MGNEVGGHEGGCTLRTDNKKKVAAWEAQESLASDPKALGTSPCLRDNGMRSDVL